MSDSLMGRASEESSRSQGAAGRGRREPRSSGLSLARGSTVTSDIHREQVAVLTRLMHRWAAEHAKVATTEPERAAHIAEAIFDLQTLIERLTAQRRA